MVLENLAPPRTPLWWEKVLRKSPTWRWIVLFVLFGLGLFYSLVLLPPADFPAKTPIVIRSETSVTKASEIFASQEALRYPVVYQIAVKVFSLGDGIQAGTYYFDRPINAVRLAWRTTTGHFGLEKIKVTFTEGTTSFLMSKQLAAVLPGFDQQKFFDLAEKEEGFLFPDTYHFLPYTPEDEIIRIMKNNFNQAVGPYRGLMAARGRDIKEVITLASIVEKEAAKLEDRKLIAGILWKRLEIDMPLQVDAAFTYYLNRSTYELTKADLQDSSPYNTYKNKGLPPGPIGNPSIEAIGATLFPTDSSYLYYLADKKGNTYYAEDFDGHKENRAKYLN